MNPFRLVRIAVAYAVLAPSAYAQPAATAAPEAKPAPAPVPQGFSVVLVLGEGQSTTIADNVPQAARKALAGR